MLDNNSHRKSFGPPYAGMALGITSQDWGNLGLGDDPNVAASDDLAVTVDRITALILIRIIAWIEPRGTYPDTSTTTICREALIKNRPWPASITPPFIAQLKQYVSKIMSGYQNVPYHNFEHGYHVIVSLNKLLDLMLCTQDMPRKEKRYTFGLKDDPLMQFALIFSALIHDVEHEGIPNRQLAIENDILAIQYNDTSIAEHRSLYVGFSELLKDDYRHLRQVVFPETEDYRRFRKTVINLVLTTDLASPERTQIGKSKWKEAFGDMYETVERKILKKLERQQSTRHGLGAVSSSGPGGGMTPHKKAISPSSGGGLHLTPRSKRISISTFMSELTMDGPEQNNLEPSEGLDEDESVSATPETSEEENEPTPTNRAASAYQRYQNTTASGPTGYPQQPSQRSGRYNYQQQRQGSSNPAAIPQRSFQQSLQPPLYQQQEEQQEIVASPSFERSPLPPTHETPIITTPSPPKRDQTTAEGTIAPKPQSPLPPPPPPPAPSNSIPTKTSPPPPPSPSIPSNTIATATTPIQRNTTTTRTTSSTTAAAPIQSNTMTTKTASAPSAPPGNAITTKTTTTYTTPNSTKTITTTKKITKTTPGTSSNSSNTNSNGAPALALAPAPAPPPIQMPSQSPSSSSSTSSSRGGGSGSFGLGGSSHGGIRAFIHNTKMVLASPSSSRRKKILKKQQSPDIDNPRQQQKNQHQRHNKQQQQRKQPPPQIRQQQQQKQQPPPPPRPQQSQKQPPPPSRQDTQQKQQPQQRQQQPPPPPRQKLPPPPLQHQQQPPQRQQQPPQRQQQPPQQQQQIVSRTNTIMSAPAATTTTTTTMSGGGSAILKTPPRPTTDLSNSKYKNGRGSGNADTSLSSDSARNDLDESFHATGEYCTATSMSRKFHRRLSSVGPVSEGGNYGKPGFKRHHRLGLLRTVDLSGEAIQTYDKSWQPRLSATGSSVFSAMNRRNQRQLPPPEEIDELRETVIMEQLLKAADVAHNLQGWHLMVKWSNRLFLELRRAYVQNRGDDPQNGWYSNQIGFLEAYLLPLARRLDDIGVFGDRVGQMFAQVVEENRDRWMDEGMSKTASVIFEGMKLYPEDD